MRVKLVFIVMSVLFFVIGCTSKEDEVLMKLKPSEDGKYNIVVFDNETTSVEFQRSVTDVYDDLLGTKISSVSYHILSEEESTREYDYKKILSIENFPEIFLFDSQGIVLRTHNPEELDQFFRNE